MCSNAAPGVQHIVPTDQRARVPRASRAAAMFSPRAVRPIPKRDARAPKHGGRAPSPTHPIRCRSDLSYLRARKRLHFHSTFFSERGNGAQTAPQTDGAGCVLTHTRAKIQVAQLARLSRSNLFPSRVYSKCVRASANGARLKNEKCTRRVPKYEQTNCGGEFGK